ncbi:MAG: hypothetical protein ACRCY3_09365 [Sphingorhabdus sp.]
MRLQNSIIAAALILAACSGPIPQPAPQPRPQPAPAPVVAAPAAPSPAPRVTGEWIDWPIEPGTWAYRDDERGSLALFGPAGANATVTLRCDRGRSRIYLSVAGNGAAKDFTIRTSSMMKSFAAVQSSGNPPYVAAEIDPRDSILDAMAFSRGRFAIEIGGLRSMAIPAWAEAGRVIEDCRA